MNDPTKATNPPCSQGCNSFFLSWGSLHFMRVSVFKPQTALGVWRSILRFRCLSELLEFAQQDQLSCQKGRSCETAGTSWICMGQSYCKNQGSWVGFGVSASIQTQGVAKGALKTVCELNQAFLQDSFGSHLIWKDPVGSSLFQSQLSWVCVCACQCECVCFEPTNLLNQIFSCSVVFKLSQWNLMCISTLLNRNVQD